MLKDILKEILTLKVTIVNIIGIMGTGKTNWCLHLANIIEKIYPQKFFKFYIRYTNMYHLKLKLSFLAKNLRKIDKKLRKHYGLMLIFDDITFIRLDLDFLQRVANIRHYKGFSGFRKYMIVFSYHYSKGCLPFLRQSHLRILTSLNTKYEIEQLKEYFDLAHLWNFYELKMSNIKKYMFHSLVNAMGNHFIYKPPKSYDKDVIVVPLPIAKKKKVLPDLWTIAKEPEKTHYETDIVKVIKKQSSIYIYGRKNGAYTNIITLKRVQ